MAKLHYVPKKTQPVSERAEICLWTALLWGQVLHHQTQMKPFFLSVSPRVLTVLNCFLSFP